MKLKALNLNFYFGVLAVTLCWSFSISSGNTARWPAFQENFPTAPADRTLTYWQSAKDAPLTALPMETATTTFRPEVPAGSDKMGHIELRGESAQTVIAGSEPHFFLFVPDTAGVHPPLLVHLTPKRGARRATAMSQRGQRGLAIVSEEIVKPHYRVLRREGGVIYMEVWGRDALESGEYAFIGSDLTRIPTFRVMENLNP